MTSDIDFIIELNNEKPTEAPPALIGEYVNGRRIIPSGEPRAGELDINYIPHLIEPMNCMGPYSGVNIVSFLKSVQAGVTFNCAENVVAYYMDANPKQILYVTATLSLLEKWTKRLEPLIDSCGYRHKIAAQVENTKSRKTGDKMYSKEYHGGSLSMTSLESPAGLRSETKQIVIIDEIDAAKDKLTTGEGTPVAVLHGRAAAFGARGKFMEFSTPTTFERSVIYKRYLMGDQRKYYVPLPCCSSYQVLDFKQLRPEYDDDGMLIAAWYECPECNGRVDNWDKNKILKHGEWRPTAVPSSSGHRSYHINTLYNPVGMMSWTGVYQKYIEALENPDELMPAFVNLYLGWPYKEEGTRPDVNKVISLRGTYKNGTVPDDVLYLVMSGDVQRGKEKYQQMSEEELAKVIAKIRADKGESALWKAGIPRIEVEVMGVGLAYKSWSVDYKVFYGHTTSGPYVGAFERLAEFIDGEEELTYRRSDGMKYPVRIGSLDASDGVTQSSIFEFCDRIGKLEMVPNINDGWLQKKKDPGVDEESKRNYDRYRIVQKAKTASIYIEISTNHYKKTLYTRLNSSKRKADTDITAPAFCDFPMNRPDHYFHMLTAEEMRQDGSFYNGGRPAEALDCRCYALCMSDVWLEREIRRAQDRAKKAGYSEQDILKHNKKWFLAKLAAAVNKSRK